MTFKDETTYWSTFDDIQPETPDPETAHDQHSPYLHTSPIRDPNRYLIAAILFAAHQDLSSPSPIIRRSAHRFIHSDTYRDFAEWLGIPPTQIAAMYDNPQKLHGRRAYSHHRRPNRKNSPTK